MKLTEQQFISAMTALGCNESDLAVENRGYIRPPEGVRATIIPCGGPARGESFSVVVVNLSDTGIGVLNAVPMNPRDNFILRFPPIAGRTAEAILCSVMYGQIVSPGKYAIGANFVRLLSTNPQRPGEAESANCEKGDVAHAGPADISHVREIEDRLSRLSL